MRRFDSLYLHDLAGLTSLHGLESAETAGDVTITTNPLLASLDGMGPLTSVGMEEPNADSNVEIEDNPLLTSVAGWSALREIGGSLSVTGNTSLAAVEAEAWAAGISVGANTTVKENGE